MNIISNAHRWMRKDGLLPNNLIYFITNRCNMKCEHCFYWESLNAKTDDLTLDEIDKVSRTIGPMLHIVLTGGEPFVRKDVADIIRVFHQNTGCELFTIPSNGFYQDVMVEQLETVLRTLPKVSVFQNVSIDGVREQHDEIRKVKNAYEKAIATFVRLKKLKERHEKLNLGIVATFTSTNQDTFKDLVKEIHEEVGPDSLFINLVRGSPKEKVNQNLDIQKYRDAVAYRNSLYDSNAMPGYTSFLLSQIPHASRRIVNETVQKTFEENRYQMPCYAGRLQAVIYSNGDVYPCELLDQKLGNVRDVGYDFSKIWFASEANDVRRDIWRTNCYCTHECFVTTNVIFNPTSLPRILKTGLKDAWLKRRSTAS